nr:FAD-binding oxidoreductase [Falsibacillus albus]
MVRRKSIIICIIILLYIAAFFVSNKQHKNPGDVMEDVSHLMPVKVHQIIPGREEQGMIDVIEEANEKGLKVSIAGKRHSQGGHTYYPGAVVLDMKPYNKILHIDRVSKTITVQSGATWDDVQKAINPYGFSVKVMQSQNIFTIGGSLSVNAHGRDIRNGSLIDTVQSFRLLTANGKVINVSRTENSEYFPLVIGGYGLFGVILDATLKLTDDSLYTYRTTAMNYKEYPDFFKNKVLHDPKAEMHIARISTEPDTFLTDMYAIDYLRADDQSKFNDYTKLKEDEGTFVTKFMLGLSRDFDWGKTLLWKSQKRYFESLDGQYITRNNAMRSESKFLEYENSDDTDILQEYYVPVDQFVPYIDDLRETLKGEDLNLMNITIRYVEKNNAAALSYAKEDMFAFVLLINQKKSSEGIMKTQKIIRKMIDVTLNHDGSYYLPYYAYPTKAQMKAAYPKADDFFESKRKLDPSERFMNEFYEEYGQ